MQVRHRKNWDVYEGDPLVYGQSVLGTNLEVWLPSSQEDKVTCLVMAGLHGSEPETTVLLSRALRMVKREALCCAVIPAANPDGLMRGTRGNTRGVDLNRNFPSESWDVNDTAFRWTLEEEPDIYLSSGDRPVSEPESAALLKLFEQLQPEYIISLHAPLACVDDPDMTDLSVWLSEQMNLPLTQDIGYPTPGSMGQWAKEKNQKLITLELPRESIEYQVRSYADIFLKLLSFEGLDFLHKSTN
ncbi:MAG: murein tripeptide amidase MpaA [Verrucomicrobiota bacterium]